MFEDNRIFADGWKLDVEILKGGQLFQFFAREINRKKIHSAIAIGGEIDAIIRSPHRADILRRIIGEILGRARLEIVDPNVICHSAAVMFPGPELAEDPVKRHFRIVRGKGDEPSARDGELLRQFCIEANGEKLADKIVERFSARAEYDQRIGVFPSHDEIVRSHSVRDIVAPKSR